MNRTFPESSFEIQIGLSDSDLQIIEQAVEEDSGVDPNGVLGELQQRRSYTRGFNITDGEDASDPELHNRMHALASRCLAEHRRAVFLRSDRYYERQPYRRERIFESARRLQSDYWRSVAFTLTANQYADQVEFLIEQMYNYPRKVGLHQLAEEQGAATGDRPTDPLAPYDELFTRLFPQYALVRTNVETINPPKELFVKLPSGVEVPLTDLSSGEQEVFFILSFFLRHDISRSMVFIDEPELHLHPELARRMVRIMLAIKPANQIWLATHNPELIDEAGVDRTYFVDRPDPAGPGRIVRASDDDSFVRGLRTIFGYAGFVDLARRLVFLEGDASSTDRKVFVNLFPDASDEIRFVPLNSSDHALRIHRAVLGILDEGLGHSEFFLIRDRDYLPDEIAQKFEDDTAGRLFVLRRHEIENYLIDTETIQEVLANYADKIVSLEEVEAGLKEVARTLAGRVLRDMVGARLNVLFQAKDCTIGAFEAQQEWLDSSMVWDSNLVDSAAIKFKESVGSARETVLHEATDDQVEQEVSAAKEEIVSALNGNGWRDFFPGKELIEKYGVQFGFKKGPFFVNTLIRQMAEHPERIATELVDIIDTILNAGSDSTNPD